jgi:hypothetical protein
LDFVSSGVVLKFFVIHKISLINLFPPFVAHAFLRVVAVAQWSNPSFASLKQQLNALRNAEQGVDGGGQLHPACRLMMMESGDAAFGLERAGSAMSNDDRSIGAGSTSSGSDSGADAFNNVVVISSLFFLDHAASVAAVLASFNAATRASASSPRFFYAEQRVGQEGSGSQVALWGYVHADGMMVVVLPLPLICDIITGEHRSMDGCLRDDMVVNRQGIADYAAAATRRCVNYVQIRCCRGVRMHFISPPRAYC